MALLEPEFSIQISSESVNLGVSIAETESGPIPDNFVAGSPCAGITALLLCQCARTNPQIGEAVNFLVLFRLCFDVLKDFDSKTVH